MGWGGWISLQSCRQWVQGLVADKATAFWEPKLSNYSQGSLCHGLKALITSITWGGGWGGIQNLGEEDFLRGELCAKASTVLVP